MTRWPAPAPRCERRANKSRVRRLQQRVEGDQIQFPSSLPASGRPRACSSPRDAMLLQSKAAAASGPTDLQGHGRQDPGEVRRTERERRSQRWGPDCSRSEALFARESEFRWHVLMSEIWICLLDILTFWWMNDFIALPHHYIVLFVIKHMSLNSFIPIRLDVPINVKIFFQLNAHLRW